MEFDPLFIREAVLAETHDAVQMHDTVALAQVAEHYVASAGVARLLAEAAQDFSYEPSLGVDEQMLAEFIGSPDEDAALLHEAASVAEEVVTDVLYSNTVDEQLTKQLDDLSQRVSPGTYALPKDASDEEYGRVAQQYFAESAAKEVKQVYREERTAAQIDEDWGNLYTRPEEAAEKAIAKYEATADANELLVEEAKRAMADAQKDYDTRSFRLARFMLSELNDELEFGDAGYSAAVVALEDIHNWSDF